MKNIINDLREAAKIHPDAASMLNAAADVIESQHKSIQALNSDFKILPRYKRIPTEDLKESAVICAQKMLKSAGEMTPDELGLGAVLCLELAIFLQGE